MGIEVVSLGWGVILDVAGHVASLDILDRQRLDVETHIVTWHGLCILPTRSAQADHRPGRRRRIRVEGPRGAGRRVRFVPNARLESIPMHGITARQREEEEGLEGGRGGEG